jgi:hypothetical protein
MINPSEPFEPGMCPHAVLAKGDMCATCHAREVAAAKRDGMRSGIGFALATVGISHGTFRGMVEDGQQPSDCTFEELFGDARAEGEESGEGERGCG